MRDKVLFYSFAIVGNIMVWGMFTVLNMPRFDAAALKNNEVFSQVQVKRIPQVGIPKRVIVPTVAMDLSVKNGNFDPSTQTWDLSDDSAYYATVSTPANDSNGTTLLYGHARDSMFAPLTKLKPGDVAYISTSNGKRFTYRFSSVREVVPTDVSVFTDYGPPTLVMQTCSGPWDSFRAMYTFDFVEVV